MNPRQTSLLGSSVTAGVLSLENNAFAVANEAPLKLALIGCGGRGSGAANQALRTRGPVQLVAMADAFKDKLDVSLENLRKEHPTKIAVPPDHQFIGFDGYKQAIPLADVVILATPPGFRPIHFEEAVRQGKHVFMEKPVAVDAPGVRQIIATAKEAKKKNLKVGVGLQRRHQRGYIDTIQRIHDGAIGDVISTRAYWTSNSPWMKPRQSLAEWMGRPLTEMEYQMRNWYYFNWLSGDHIVEQHIHNIDVINWIKNGHPIRAQGQGGRQVRKGSDFGEIFDHHFVEFEYADGSFFSSQCRHIQKTWNQVSEHAVGTKGRADFFNGGYWRIHGANEWKFEDTRQDAYQQEQDDLFAAIRNDTPYNEADVAAISAMTAIMGRMATYSGKRIEWDEAFNSTMSLLPKRFAWDAETPSKPDATGMYAAAVPGVSLVL